MSSAHFALVDRPAWQRQVRPRLAISLAIAALLLAAVLLLTKFAPLPEMRESIIELQVVIATEETEEDVEEPIELEEVPIPAEIVEPERVVEQVEQVEPTESVQPQVTDWYAVAETAAQETVTAANHVDSMHPVFDEKRRMAAINFAPSRAPVKKPIWENVETDQMGRKVLVSGDCYRVLEDWRATYDEIHRQMGQYIINCNASFDKPMDVAWVDEIGEGYEYLESPDGEFPRQRLSAASQRPQE